MLIDQGYTFSSQTDTEVIAHLLDFYWDLKQGLTSNVRRITQYLEGAYGILVLHKQYPDSLVAIKCGSPIVVGYGIGENFISSDALSLLPVTQKFSYLDEGRYS